MTQIVDKIKYILIFKINLQKKESNFKKKVQAIMNLINNLKNSIKIEKNDNQKGNRKILIKKLKNQATIIEGTLIFF